MLSKREKEFLEHPEKFNLNYARLMRHRIKKRVAKCMEDMKFLVTLEDKWLKEIIENHVRENKLFRKKS